MTEPKKPEPKPKYDPKKIYFSWYELQPILKDWADRLMGGPGIPHGPIKPFTNFPEIGAKDLGGKPTSIEHLLADLGMVPAVIMPQEKYKDRDLKVNIKVQKPYWIPEFIWFKCRLKDLAVKFVSVYCKVSLIDVNTGEEALEKGKEIK